MIGIVQTLLNKLALTEWTVQLRSADNTMFVLTSFEHKYNLTARFDADKSELSLQASSFLPESFIELKGIPYTVATAANLDRTIEAAHRDGNKIAVATTAYSQAMRGQ